MSRRPPPEPRDEEMLYLDFISDVTRDIVAQGVYSDRFDCRVSVQVPDANAGPWQPSAIATWRTIGMGLTGPR